MTGYPVSNHMPINTTNSPKGGMLATAVANLQAAINQWNAIQAIMAQCASDTSYGDLEKTFGLTNNETTGSTSTGSNAKYQFDAACAALANSAITQALAQFG